MIDCKHPPESVVRLLHPSKSRPCEIPAFCTRPVEYHCEACGAWLCATHAGPDETKEDPNA